MKTYINKTNELRCVVFEDDSAQFLMRGQKFTTDKVVKKIQTGIVVKEETSKDESTVKKTAKKSESETNE